MLILTKSQPCNITQIASHQFVEILTLQIEFADNMLIVIRYKYAIIHAVIGQFMDEHIQLMCCRYGVPAKGCVLHFHQIAANSQKQTLLLLGFNTTQMIRTQLHAIGTGAGIALILG